MEVSRAAGTPEDVYGPLYQAVELARVFPDSKTFAGMAPRESLEGGSHPCASISRHVAGACQAAESGWDYGSRWLGDGRTLVTIHTTDIVPVDLNSLMWNLEMAIARRCTAAGDTTCARDCGKQADARKAAMTKYLWSGRDRRFTDWDRSTGRPTASISAAILYPLFVGLAASEQAEATAELTEARLLAPRGAAHHHRPHRPAVGRAQRLGAAAVDRRPGARPLWQEGAGRYPRPALDQDSLHLLRLHRPHGGEI